MGFPNLGQPKSNEHQVYNYLNKTTGLVEQSLNPPETMDDPNYVYQSPAGYTKKVSVICGEIYRRGDMPEHIREADERVGAAQSAEVMAGYHAWGIPVVKLMQRSELAYKIAKVPALHWAYYMAYKEGVIEKRDNIGAVMHHIGVPVCYGIGLIVRTVKVSATQKV